MARPDIAAGAATMSCAGRTRVSCGRHRGTMSGHRRREPRPHDQAEGA